MSSVTPLPLLPVYQHLIASHFNSAELESAIASLSRTPDRDAAMQDLLEAFATEPPNVDPFGMELITAFAALLVILSDRPTALQAVRLARERFADAENATFSALLALQEWLGEPVTYQEAPPPRAIIEKMAAAYLEGARQSNDAPEYLAYAMGAIPVPTRIPVADWLLERLSSRERRRFAALAMLGPGGPTLRVHLARGFAHGGPEARELLDRLSVWELPDEERRAAERPVAAERVRALKRPPLSELPFDWPIEEAWATPPDASGAQGFVLIRRQGPGRYALFSTVGTPILGFTQSFGRQGLTRTECDRLLDEMRESGMLLSTMPAEYVIARIKQHLRHLHERDIPLGYDFLAWRYLLSGLWDRPEADLFAQAMAWADPERLDETDLLLGDDWTEELLLINDGTRGTEAFFADCIPLLDEAREVRPKSRKVQAPDLDASLAEAIALPFSAAVLKKLDALIDRHAEAIATPAERRFWRDLLVQLAHMYATFDMTGLRTLCATAAWALDPDSGIPIVQQPFWRQLLRNSAYDDHAFRKMVRLDAESDPGGA